MRDVELDELERGSRRVVAPEAVDQPVHADCLDPVCSASIASTARCFAPPRPTAPFVDGLDRPEQVDVQSEIASTRPYARLPDRFNRPLPDLGPALYRRGAAWRP